MNAQQKDTFCFNPDKRVESDSPITNGERAESAGAMISLVLDYSPDDKHTALVDSLANILHWCDREGLNFDDALESASMHHDAER